MASKNLQQRASVEQKEKIARDAAKLENLWAGYDNNTSGKKVVYSNRYEVPPPEPLDTSKYNPYKIVDIVTFISHPHFLGLSPYPWQLLSLKLFYMGSPGNTHLELNASSKEDEDGCNNCVWNYLLENEIDNCEKIENGENTQRLLRPINSRCLQCNRCPLKIRNTVLNHELDVCGDVETENIIKKNLENETDDLYQSELDLIEQIPDEAVKLQIKNKLKKRFKELVLIMGRRSGKSFLTCAIGLYEIYKLLSMGHPQKKLGQPDLQEIYILNVAKNQEQAQDSIFTPMKNWAVSSPFFKKYIGVDNALEMKFRTDFDITENERRSKTGHVPLAGTIIAKCGSSSAGGLVGKTCWCIIIDELAAMAGDKPNGGDDKKLYNELKPSLKTFQSDGKIICLSNPKGPFGQLYTLYNSRLEDLSTLILKLPTWIINADINVDELLSEKRQDPVEFNMQFGAEFGTNSENPFLDPEDVKYAFENSERLTRCEKREGQHEYYCHIDPSNRNDYYTLVVCHAIPTGQKDFQGNAQKRYIVDHIQYWAPVHMKQPVNVKEVEDYLLDLHSRFRFKQISFDQWHSSETIKKLSGMGLPVVLRVFNKEYKDKIYINLLEAFRSKNIEFYRMSSGKATDKNEKIFDINEIPEAKDQFTFLQKKWKTNRQVIEALSGYKDDICDATAAAIYECSQETTVAQCLPRSRIAYTGRSFR
jgi:hypothetical protein